MDFPSKSIIDVLTYLLPGFVTAALVYNLTPALRPIPFERVVQALIYTMVVQVLLVVLRTLSLLLGRLVGAIGEWTPSVNLVWSVVVAAGLGLLLVWAANTDRMHSVLRTLGITFQTSFASEWYGALSQNRGYVVLHLKGERRLYGWPEEWPSSPGQGHFVVSDAEWLTTDSRISLDSVRSVLVRAEDVEMVEMMKAHNQPNEERSDGRQEESNTTTTSVGTLRESIAADVTAPAAQAATTTTTAAKEIAASRMHV